MINRLFLSHYYKCTKLTFDWCHDFCCFLSRITTVLLSTPNLIVIIDFSAALYKESLRLSLHLWITYESRLFGTVERIVMLCRWEGNLGHSGKESYGSLLITGFMSLWLPRDQRPDSQTSKEFLKFFHLLPKLFQSHKEMLKKIQFSKHFLSTSYFFLSILFSDYVQLIFPNILS